MLKILLINLLLVTLNASAGENFLLEQKTKKIKFSKKEMIYLKNKHVIQMCVDPDWMPLEKIIDGEYIGISSDYVRYFQSYLKTPIKIVPTSFWAESLEYVKDRKCDILPLALDTKERRKYLNFTKKYLIMPLAISTKIEEHFIYEINHISNIKKIGLIKGYAYGELVRKKYPNLNIVEVRSMHDGLVKVENGELYGMIDIGAALAYNIQKNYAHILKVAGKFDDNYGLSVGVRSDDLILLNLFNKAIEDMDKHLHQQILNRWISVKYEKGMNYTLLFQILLGVFIIVLFGLYRQFLLKNTNKTLQSLVKEEIDKNKQKDIILRTQSKNAAMGEMLTLITHQWRQPLNEIGLVLQKFKYADERGTLTSELIAEQTKLGNDLVVKMSTTIDDFKNFLLPHKEETNFLSSSSIQNIIKLLNASYKYNNIKIIQELKSSKKIYGRRGEFEQALLNILNNAKDALILKEITDKVVLVKTYELNSNLIIEIYDNGGGINKRSINKIFDAYFTTKLDGTGIGLYISKEIICEHLKGKITVKNVSFTVDSKNHYGACFKIIF